jgi:predicted dithiol-disulfide oxidoreductase (DUF899 family)
MSSYQEQSSLISNLEKEMTEVREKLVKAHQEREPETIKEFNFQGVNGSKTLSQLFGDKDELILIHFMGKSCSYCTLWADGYNGYTEHFQSRAAFAVTTPDDIETASAFAEERGWRFPVYSTNGNDFQKAMGFYGEKDEHPGPWPGVSIFIKDGDQVKRKTQAMFGPGDLFCGAWHFFDLLPNGPDGWQPGCKE